MKIAAATGRFLINAITGLWHLCTCCVAPCAQVYLLHSCQTEFDPEKCQLHEGGVMWVCSDVTVPDADTSDPVDLADLQNDNGVIESVSGCLLVGDLVDFEDIPDGAVQWPKEPTDRAHSGVRCDDEDGPCEVDLTGTCDCLCHAPFAVAGACCYGLRGPDGAGRLDFDYTYDETFTTASQKTAFHESFLSCLSSDCDEDKSCTFYEKHMRLAGGMTRDNCEVCRDSETREVGNSSGCCSDETEVYDGEWHADANPICTRGNPGPPALPDYFTVQATLDDCVQGSGEVRTLLIDTCFRQQVLYVATSKLFSTVIVEGVPRCGCQTEQIRTVTEDWEWFLEPPLSPDETRLCAMCELFLSGGD